MDEGRIKRLLILGGGTAGWMTAALLSKLFGEKLSITLVESDKISTIGVGEATIPLLHTFNQALGIDENRFIARTKGTIKLGIEFQGWGDPDSCYMHAFGGVGHHYGLSPFAHYYLRARANGSSDSLWDYSLNARAAYAGKFDRLPRIEGTPLTGLNYAYHFDAGLYAQFLRAYAEEKGVERIEGTVTSVERDGETGHVTSITLEGGASVSADFFIDCSGFRAILADNDDFIDWSHWLPCDRAVACPSENVGPPRPYTQSIARAAGWQWRIPLQHRTGNGYVFSSAHVDDDTATRTLLDNLEGKALADPRVIRFRTGRRERLWDKNVVSIGLSGGFLEPLESTSIHLIQQGIIKLARLFPEAGDNGHNADEYNRQMGTEFDYIRDFIILHYYLQRRDEPIWKACAAMDIPESLSRRIDLFRRNGRIFREQTELFQEVGWLQVMIGQGLWPERYDQMAEALPQEELDQFLSNLKIIMGGAVDKLPSHQQFIDRVVGDTA